MPKVDKITTTTSTPIDQSFLFGQGSPRSVQLRKKLHILSRCEQERPFQGLCTVYSVETRIETHVTPLMLRSCYARSTPLAPVDLRKLMKSIVSHPKRLINSVAAL